MQRSRIIITYLMLSTNLTLNGARMMNYEIGGEIFVFWKSWKWGVLCSVLLIN